MLKEDDREPAPAPPIQHPDRRIITPRLANRLHAENMESRRGVEMQALPNGSAQDLPPVAKLLPTVGGPVGESDAIPFECDCSLVEEGDLGLQSSSTPGGQTTAHAAVYLAHDAGYDASASDGDTGIDGMPSSHDDEEHASDFDTSPDNTASSANLDLAEASVEHHRAPPPYHSAGLCLLRPCYRSFAWWVHDGHEPHAPTFVPLRPASLQPTHEDPSSSSSAAEKPPARQPRYRRRLSAQRFLGLQDVTDLLVEAVTDDCPAPPRALVANAVVTAAVPSFVSGVGSGCFEPRLPPAGQAVCVGGVRQRSIVCATAHAAGRQEPSVRVRMDLR